MLRLRERAEELESDRERRAREAVAAERRRIAGELHDVVTHSVSVMVVQAAAARRLVPTDPARAREAMEAIERTGREALNEMRRLLGVLRRGDEDIALTPQPTLKRLDLMLAVHRHARRRDRGGRPAGDPARTGRRGLPRGAGGAARDAALRRGRRRRDRALHAPRHRARGHGRRRASTRTTRPRCGSSERASASRCSAASCTPGGAAAAAGACVPGFRCRRVRVEDARHRRRRRARHRGHARGVSQLEPRGIGRRQPPAVRADRTAVPRPAAAAVGVHARADRDHVAGQPGRDRRRVDADDAADPAGGGVPRRERTRRPIGCARGRRAPRGGAGCDRRARQRERRRLRLPRRDLRDHGISCTRAAPPRAAGARARIAQRAPRGRARGTGSDGGGR